MDPELIVVGGGLSNAGPALLEPISDRVHSLVPLRGLNIIQSALGDQAAALGAVRRAADLAESRLVQIGEAT